MTWGLERADDGTEECVKLWKRDYRDRHGGGGVARTGAAMALSPPRMRVEDSSLLCFSDSDEGDEDDTIVNGDNNNTNHHNNDNINYHNNDNDNDNDREIVPISPYM